MPYIGSNPALRGQNTGARQSGYVGSGSPARSGQSQGIVGAKIGGRAPWAPGSSGSQGTTQGPGAKPQTSEAQKKAEKLAETRRKAAIMSNVEKYMKLGGLTYDQAVARVGRNLMSSSAMPFKDLAAAETYIRESWGNTPSHPGNDPKTYAAMTGDYPTSQNREALDRYMPPWERAMLGLSAAPVAEGNTGPQTPVSGEHQSYASELIPPPPSQEVMGPPAPARNWLNSSNDPRFANSRLSNPSAQQPASAMGGGAAYMAAHTNPRNRRPQQGVMGIPGGSHNTTPEDALAMTELMDPTGIVGLGRLLFQR